MMEAERDAGRADERSIVVTDPQRATKAIIMMADAAIGHLGGLGYHRRFDAVRIEQTPDEMLPMWVSVRGERVFEIDFFVGPNGRVNIRGIWTRGVPPLGRMQRLWRWIRARVARG